MAIRKDKIQLDVEINGKKAGKTYNELINDSRNLKRELRALTPGTDAFIKKSAELQKVNTRLASIRDQTKAVRKGTNTMGAAFKKLLPALGAAAIVAGLARVLKSLFNIGKEAFKLFDIQAKADAQIKAALKSTQNAVGRTFQDLKKQAQDLQKVSLFGDEQIQQAQGVLLTFTKVSGDINKRATETILDVSTALKTDLKSTSLQIGKALNDPLLGITALSRAGVQFTVDQKAMIKSMVEAGDTAGAQGVILKELETQFKGSAQAAAEAGNGPYTQLKNRLSDVKENIGLLINRGLKPLQPIFAAVVTFAEKFVQRLVDGKKATDEMSTGVNTLFTVMKFLVDVFRTGFIIQSKIYGSIKDFLIPIFVNLGERINTVIENGRNMFIIGSIITGISKAVGFFKDLISDTNATFEGFRAGAQQAVENIKSYFNGLVLSAQIAAKKLDRALSIRKETKDRLKQEIKDLETLKDAAESSGTTIGEAYANARNNAIKANAIVNDKTPTQVPDFAPNISLPETSSDTNTNAPGQGSNAQRQSIQPLESLDTLQAQPVSLASDEQINLAQARADRQLEILKDAGAKELNELQIQFLQQMLTEQEFETEELLAKENNLQQKLNLLQAYGLTETDAFRKTQIAQLEVQKEIDSKKLENAQRTAEMKAQLESDKREALTKTIDIGIKLLSKDEQSRKKHATALKAFEIAKIGINLPAEIQGIWKNAKITLPEPFATILATAQTAFAIARSQQSIAKIGKTKFFYGGLTGNKAIYNDDQGGVAGVVHTGEWVSPQWMVDDPVYGPTISYLESVRRNKGGYMVGGLADTDTTPVGLASVPINNDAGSSSDIKMVLDKMGQVLDAISAFPASIKAHVVASEVDAVNQEIADIEELASF